MKKYVQNFWVRFLACILCTITLMTGAASGLLLAGVSFAGDREDIDAFGKEQIAKNYAAYIYDHLDDMEKLENFLKTKNFSCSVDKIDNSPGEDVSLEDRKIGLYSNLEDSENYNYELEILDGAYVRYNVESAVDALRISPVVETTHYTEVTPIVGYVFDQETGLFYYQTSSGYYFAVDYIMVSGEEVYDYDLLNMNNKKVYYNSYYDLTLDTSNYEDWNWVKINDVKMSISKNPSMKEVAVVTDGTDIQANLYTDVFYFEDSDRQNIEYYSDAEADRYIIRMKIADIPVNTMTTYPDDMFSQWVYLQEAFFENVPSYQAVLVLSVILFILSFALLIYSANEKKEKLGFSQKIPVGIFTGCAILIEIILVVFMGDVLLGTLRGYIIFPINIWILLFGLTAFVIVFVAFIWLQNIITRIKAKSFLRYSECYYGYKILKWTWSKVTQPFKVIVEMVKEHTPLVVRALAILVLFSFAEFFVVLMCWWDTDAYLLFFMPLKVVEILLVIVVTVQMKKLQEGSKRIAAGDLSEPIDTSKMFWEFKRHGENINKVSDGIALAVDERMKSERFKTELITNVSHDIKTPLTSIINYVDLIKKEEIADETLKEYVDVLDRQSNRLKKLIEDLMEASKASTGNLNVNMEDCDVEVLLTQLIGEFEEKISVNQLEVVVQKPEHPVVVSADGRHMWRVFDNLLNNACKYSMPGTRVYVSLVQEHNTAIITFKNISKAALNIPSDELMERFVRGDSSRNTEGSGLGLSIAQSLTELMKGTMKLEIDGDLFKVTLKFQVSGDKEK